MSTERAKRGSDMSVRVALVDAAVTTELRRAVLRPSKPVGTMLFGDDDPAALHLGAFADDGALLSTCMLVERPFALRPDDLPAWQLRAMATAESARGRGAGRAVLAAVDEELRSRGARLVWCNAREPAVAFYARHGYLGTGAIFIGDETGLPHLLMWRELGGASTSS